MYYQEPGEEFLNQVLASHRPVRTWFLKIDPIWIVSMCMCVCVSAPKVINNLWHDMDSIQLVKQVMWQL